MTTPSRNLFKKIEAVNQGQMSLRLDCSGQETEWDYFIWDTGREDLEGDHCKIYCFKIFEIN